MKELIARNNPKSPVAEAFRTIRTNLQFAGVDKKLKTILFTSSMPDEGKSTVIANLGIVMAEAGSKVLIIDCDFRNPTQHKVFHLENKGLSNHIANGKSVAEILQPSGTEGLDVLTSGPVAPNPSEILGSASMKTLLECASERYDYVLIDAPPVLPVTDAAVLASRVDGVILITAWNKIDPAMAKESKTRLDKAGAKILGVLFNKVEVGSNGHGSGYGYGYYHTYGMEEEKETKGE